MSSFADRETLAQVVSMGRSVEGRALSADEMAAAQALLDHPDFDAMSIDQRRAFYQRELAGAAAGAEANRIPSGLWQRAAGLILFAIGLFAWFAATPFNGAWAAATMCFAIAAPLTFWGLMLKYLRVLEDRILDLGAGAPAAGRTHAAS
ncbi:MAG: hypothetical protein ACTHM0_13450 [Sphingomonas sp.]